MNINLFQAGAELGLEKIIFASSIQVISGKRAEVEPGTYPPSQLPYLPIDGDVRTNPGSTYALSKEATENLLRYYATDAGMSCIAIRFPWVLRLRDVIRYRKYITDLSGHTNVAIDETFAYLVEEDAATLVQAVAERELPGYRCYLAAADGPRLTMSIPELVGTCYAGVPLKQPVEELTSLVDISRITKETGWIPRHSLWDDPEDDA